MTTIDIKKLNNTPIDWCYNCAKAACKTSKQKMFAWIVCFLMKSCNSNTDYYYELLGIFKRAHIQSYFELYDYIKRYV